MMRKQYKRRPAVLPLGTKHRDKTELPALIALTAIGEPWFSEQHRTDLLAVAMVVEELAEPGSMQSRCAIELGRLCSQAVTRDQKIEVALNLAECLPWLQIQPNHRIDRAIESLSARHLAVAA